MNSTTNTSYILSYDASAVHGWMLYSTAVSGIGIQPMTSRIAHQGECEEDISAEDLYTLLNK